MQLHWGRRRAVYRLPRRIECMDLLLSEKVEQEGGETRAQVARFIILDVITQAVIILFSKSMSLRSLRELNS